MLDGGALIDVHAHFHSPHTNRTDWQRYNQSRLHAGKKMGVDCHVASVLGSWGHSSPTYFASPEDQTRANEWMIDFAQRSDNVVRAYVAVNPNFTRHALREIERGFAAGAIGVKLAAGRRADDTLLDEIADAAARHHAPLLHHVWHHRQRDWPNQDASDGLDLARLAARHPATTFIMAHIGGGGDYTHSYAAARGLDNLVMDLSGSGIDRGMLDLAIERVGVSRLLWACDITMCTGFTKLLALAHVGLNDNDIEAIRWRNAIRIFPPRTFSSVEDKAAGILQSPAM